MSNSIEDAFAEVRESLRHVWARLNLISDTTGHVYATALAGSGTIRSKGTATIASGTTAITVTHSAGFTPTVQDIYVTPSANTTNDPGNWWVDSITSTQFAINCRADPGAGGMPFGWTVFKA